MRLWAGWELAWIAFTVLALAYSATEQETGSALTSWRLTDALGRWTLWDGNYFLAIAYGGYPPALHNLAAFYPLYPALVHGALSLAGPFIRGVSSGPQLVALAVDQLAALAALLGLAALAESDASARGEPAAERAAVVRWTLAVLLAYPLALFLLAAYSDAVYLALAVWALYCARRRRWLVAAVCLLLAGLARPVAPALALPVTLEYLASLRGLGATLTHWRERILAALGAPALFYAALWGMAAFMLFCWRRYGSLTMPAQAERLDFGRILAGPWTGIGLSVQEWRTLPPLSYEQIRWLTDVAPLAACVLAALGLAALAILAALPYLARHRPLAERWAQLAAWARGVQWPASYTVYVAGVLAIILCTPITSGLFPSAYPGAGRFVLSAFPLALAAGRLFARYPASGRVVLTAAVVAQAVLAAYVLRGGWLI